MKTLAFAILMILVGVNALPDKTDVKKTRDATEHFFNVIDTVRQRIPDPIYIYDDRRLVYPEADERLKAYIFVEDFEATGASIIIINDISHNLATKKLTFDLSIPEFSISRGGVGVGVKILNFPMRRAYLKGRYAIDDIRITGEVDADVESSSKITYSNLVINTTIGGFESDLHFEIVGYDLSNQLNHFLGNILPIIINNNMDRTNRVLEGVLLFLLKFVM